MIQSLNNFPVFLWISINIVYQLIYELGLKQMYLRQSMSEKMSEYFKDADAKRGDMPERQVIVQISSQVSRKMNKVRLLNVTMMTAIFCLLFLSVPLAITVLVADYAFFIYRMPVKTKSKIVFDTQDFLFMNTPFILFAVLSIWR